MEGMHSAATHSLQKAILRLLQSTGRITQGFLRPRHHDTAYVEQQKQKGALFGGVAFQDIEKSDAR